MSHYTDLIGAFKDGWDQWVLYDRDCDNFRYAFVEKFAAYLETDPSNVIMISEKMVYEQSFCIFEFRLHIITEFECAPQMVLTYTVYFKRADQVWIVKVHDGPEEYRVSADLSVGLDEVFAAILENAKKVSRNRLDYRIGAARTKTVIGFVKTK